MKKRIAGLLLASGLCLMLADCQGEAIALPPAGKVEAGTELVVVHGKAGDAFHSYSSSLEISFSAMARGSTARPRASRACPKSKYSSA